MTEKPQTPQEGMASALHELSDQTRVLVRREVNAAQRELWMRARQSAPVVMLAAASGLLGLFAAAAWYRLSVRLLEQRLPPAGAALAAAAGYSIAAAGTAAAAAVQVRSLPSLLPEETVAEASSLVAGAAAKAGGVPG